jgi:glycosyltransferase involved in cell wall biosynthesis
MANYKIKRSEDGAEKMRICMISGYAGVGGGLENVVNELSSELAKQGNQVTIFNNSSKDMVKEFSNIRTEELRPYKILPPRLKFANYSQYTYSLKVWIRIRNSNHFDLIHGHGDNCFFPMLFRDSTPFVANIHGIKKAYRTRVFGSNSNMVKGPRLFPLFWPEEIAAKRSDITVACSKAERDELISYYGVASKKIKVIYNGVDISKFKPMDKRTARKTLGLPEDCNFAIWVGNNPPLKGLKIAIKAVKDIKNLYLLVAGISGENFDNVLFYGMVADPKKLCTLYNAADFLILPTLYEGFPLVPLEALACGVPIIISKECPTREIIRDGVEGFIVDQRKPECYAEKILTLLNDYSSKETSIHCRRLSENYSWSNAVKEYIKLYSQVVN